MDGFNYHLKEGSFYQATFNNGGVISTYTGIAVSKSQVDTFTKNGAEYKTRGTLSGAESIEEITKEVALHPLLFHSNEESLHLLRSEE